MIENTGSVAPEQSPRPSVEFVFADHSPENLPKVADAFLATNADIYAIEKIREGSFGMGTAEDKTVLGQKMTDFISASNNSPATASEVFETDEPFFTRLLDGLKGSGKQVVLIDIGTDDPRYQVYRDSIVARQKVINKQDDPLSESDTIEDLLLDSQIAQAQSNELREAIMKEQIEDLVARNPSAKIAAMMGAYHTPTSYQMQKVADVKRTFVPTDEEQRAYKRGEKFRFDETGSSLRHITRNLGKAGLSKIGEFPRTHRLQ